MGRSPPRPRGLPQFRVDVKKLSIVSPAPAGIAPDKTSGSPARSRLPRARGDCPLASRPASLPAPSPPRPRGLPQVVRSWGSSTRVSPAPAGIAPTPTPCEGQMQSLPRARGDCPFSKNLRSGDHRSPPRPRGLPLVLRWRSMFSSVSPAPAGIAPTFAAWRCVTLSLPRARGDCPSRRRLFNKRRMSPPRPRGLP